ncbi:MAG TPA: YbjN domain-containing protein [Kofleriaceae bacterium]|jgi:hypothetical protein|nr:YbjN domain-containing protein [Kofleriaceae bacterium]
MQFTLGFDSLRSLCERCGLAFKANEDTEQIALLHRVLDEDAPMYLVPHAGRGLVSCVLPLPFRVPAERRAAVGEAATRLNAAGCAGCWTLDAGSGELSFRMTLAAHGVAYDDDGVLFVTRVVASAVEAAAADLQQIALGGRSSFELWPRAGLVPG